MINKTTINTKTLGIVNFNIIALIADNTGA